jgi:hypothetical protein
MSIQLKAAFGKVNITPEEPVSLQGYDPDTNIADPVTDWMDDLFARVLIMDDGQSRKVIVNVDCCLTNEQNGKVADPSGRPDRYREFINTFPEGTRDRWARAAGTDKDGISVNATHTHTAPAHFSEKYIARIQQLIERLNHELRPVNVNVAVGTSKISAFRRPYLRADLSVSVNQTLNVLYFETVDRKPLGAVVNYAVHPTALRNPTNRISGDIVGLAISEVEEQMDDGFTCMFIQGFSGDICPLYGDNGPKADTYPAVKQGGTVLCSDIMEAIQGKREIAVLSLKSSSKDIDLPTRNGFYKDSMKVTLMGIALGEILILSVSGEIFNDYIAKIESVSPYRYNLLSGVSNGYSGYIPTLKAFRDGMGGYEMNTTPFDESVEQLFMKEIEEFIRSLE